MPPCALLSIVPPMFMGTPESSGAPLSTGSPISVDALLPVGALVSVDALLPLGALVFIFVSGWASVHGCASEHGLLFYCKKSWNFFVYLKEKQSTSRGTLRQNMRDDLRKKRFWKRFLCSFSRSSFVWGFWCVSHKFWCNHWRVCPNVLSCPGVSTSSS